MDKISFWILRIHTLLYLIDIVKYFKAKGNETIHMGFSRGIDFQTIRFIRWQIINCQRIFQNSRAIFEIGKSGMRRNSWKSFKFQNKTCLWRIQGIFIHTLRLKILWTLPSVWSKTALNTGGVGGCKFSTISIKMEIQ